jgi:hypothetical protein
LRRDFSIGTPKNLASLTDEVNETGRFLNRANLFAFLKVYNRSGDVRLGGLKMRPTGQSLDTNNQKPELRFPYRTCGCTKKANHAPKIRPASHSPLEAFFADEDWSSPVAQPYPSELPGKLAAYSQQKQTVCL